MKRKRIGQVHEMKFNTQYRSATCRCQAWACYLTTRGIAEGYFIEHLEKVSEQTQQETAS